MAPDLNLVKKDYLLRATTHDGSIRAFVAKTTHTVQEAFIVHQMTPVMSAALGRLLTGGAMMGAMLKNEEDLLTLSVKGDGDGGGLLVTANNKIDVKGYPFNASADMPNKENGKLNVSGILGFGSLTVIKDMGLKEPYVGQVELVSGEIAEDLAYYFAKSEQTPSVVSLGVLVDVDYSILQAGGFIIQLLPFADDETIDKLEKTIQNFPSVTTLMDEGKSPEDILELLLGQFGYDITEEVPISFFCNCSHQRVEKALVSLGRTEIESILEEDKKATLHCHFCNKQYDFSEDDLRNILTRV